MSRIHVYGDDVVTCEERRVVRFEDLEEAVISWDGVFIDE